MVLTYYEIKEAIEDSYERLHIRGDYDEYNTFFASLNDYDQAEDFTLTEECCIYINFAIIFVNNKENFDFMKDKLIELLDDGQIDLYKSDLGNAFQEFLNDVNIIKRHL